MFALITLASHLECSISELGLIGIDSLAVDQFDLVVKCHVFFHDAEQASETFDVSHSQSNSHFSSWPRETSPVNPVLSMQHSTSVAAPSAISSMLQRCL